MLTEGGKIIKLRLMLRKYTAILPFDHRSWIHRHNRFYPNRMPRKGIFYLTTRIEPGGICLIQSQSYNNGTPRNDVAIIELTQRDRTRRWRSKFGSRTSSVVQPMIHSTQSLRTSSVVQPMIHSTQSLSTTIWLCFPSRMPRKVSLPCHENRAESDLFRLQSQSYNNGTPRNDVAKYRLTATRQDATVALEVWQPYLICRPADDPLRPVSVRNNLILPHVLFDCCFYEANLTYPKILGHVGGTY
ncbi:hypothetical protein J6590_029146 [Homalodisca vitripennis]|nr:hypothetical protein J6590_029146 [Homalodisca vitripennis]